VAVAGLSVAVLDGPASLALELAGLGHHVSLVLTRELREDEAAACRARGVEVSTAPTLDVVPASPWLTSGYRLYRALRGSHEDVLVFEGHDAYCATRAKQLGLDFGSAAIVARFGDGHPPLGFLSKSRAGELLTDRLVLELADAVVCDTASLEWWRDQGWSLPPRRYVRSERDDDAQPAAGWAKVLQPHAQARPARALPELVSVVVPFHERTTYLHQCLEGLARQTYERLEVIVADDGSASPAAKRYLGELESRKWPWPFRVLRLPHGGVGATRNRAVGVAEGDAIVFVDDDVLFPDLVEVLVRGQSHAGVDVVAAATRVFRGEGPPRPGPADKVTIPFGEARELGLLGNHFGSVTCIWPRPLLDELGGFRDVFFEDWELLARAAFGGARIAGTPDPLLWYRLTRDARFSGSRLADRLEARSAIAELYAGTLPAGTRLLPLLAAGAYGELDRREHTAGPPPGSLARRARRLYPDEGIAELMRRGIRLVGRRCRARAR
jgi:glycosyltransferase involved in cell wall biosynthesis